jgi:DNA-binding CsgD family transcriptional regulator
VNQTNRPQFILALLDRWLAPVVDQVGPAAGRLRDEGRDMPLDEVIAAGLDPRPEDPWRVGTSPALTVREREIAALVCDRQTNRQIAGELFLSEKTVETHLRNIFVKLRVGSRVEVARAVERGRSA